MTRLGSNCHRCNRYNPGFAWSCYECAEPTLRLVAVPDSWRATPVEFVNALRAFLGLRPLVDTGNESSWRKRRSMWAAKRGAA